MDRMIKKIAAGCLVCLLFLSGCNRWVDSTVPTSKYDTAALSGYTPIAHSTQYYDNYQFNAYYNPAGAAEHLPDQGIYGSGNAYILRYNGMYYMYMGTSNMNSASLPCWQSQDLMHWEGVDNGVNTPGTIAEDSRLFYTFPPCVRQYNGTFYMYLYIKNDLITQGNYILKADSPVGPFSFVTDEQSQPVCYTIDQTTLNIDCDIFIDDNEDVYFMSGHIDEDFVGIRAFRMPTMDSVSYDAGSYINIANSDVGGWTEGNGIFKRNGNYYLMYTGSNILSPGYLTHYSVATSDAWKAAFENDTAPYAQGFQPGLDWPMGCETEQTFYALGHATSVLGPDMDGLYYHYFSVNGVGPNCSFCIDRLIFNGTGMDSAQTQYHSVTPQRPAIYSYDPANDAAFTAENGKLLSNAVSGSTFTAEFNFVGSDVRCVVSFTDQQNYAFVQTDLKNKEVALYTVVAGVQTKVAAGAIVRDYDRQGLLQTVRIAYRDGKADVYFDDLLKIENAEVDLKAGAIGYLYEGAFSSGYVACSNVAKGLSDAIEPKLSYINIGAESYLPTGVYQGHGSVFTAQGSGFSPVDANEYGGQQVGLGKMQLCDYAEQASYLVDFGQDGNYALQMTYNKNNAGKSIGIRVDGGEMTVLTFPAIEPTDGSQIVKATLGAVKVSTGVREITFYGLDQQVTFHSFTFRETVEQGYAYAAKLDVLPDGAEALGQWSVETGAVTAVAAERSLLYLGQAGLTDYTVECDFKLNGDNGMTGGFIIHGARYSDSKYVDEGYHYMQGYYVALTKRAVGIEKLNFTQTNPNGALAYTYIEPGEWHHAEIIVTGNTVSVTVTNAYDRGVSVSYTDSILLGGSRFGLYSAGGSISYANLTVSG